MAPRVDTLPKSTNVTKPPGCRTIFIKNLPYECDESEIRDVFMVYGKINSVRLARWGHTNHLKGFGYVEFKTEDSADVAVRKSGSIIVNGRKLICDFETGQPKGSFKDSNEIIKKIKIAR
jgi:nucleolin